MYIFKWAIFCKTFFYMYLVLKQKLMTLNNVKINILYYLNYDTSNIDINTYPGIKAWQHNFYRKYNTIRNSGKISQHYSNNSTFQLTLNFYFCIIFSRNSKKIADLLKKLPRFFRLSFFWRRRTLFYFTSKKCCNFHLNNTFSFYIMCEIPDRIKVNNVCN